MNGSDVNDGKILNKIKDLLSNNNVCIGTQTLTVTSSAQQLTVPQGVSYALIQVQSDATGKAIRYWSDGKTVPTSSTGMFKSDGESFDIISAQTVTNLKIILAQAGTTYCFVEYYKQ